MKKGFATKLLPKQAAILWLLLIAVLVACPARKGVRSYLHLPVKESSSKPTTAENCYKTSNSIDIQQAATQSPADVLPVLLVAATLLSLLPAVNAGKGFNARYAIATLYHPPLFLQNRQLLI